MPRSQLTALGPCTLSARSMTAVSPVERNCCPSACEASPQVVEVVDLAVEDDHVFGQRVDHRLGAGRREV